MRQHISIRTGIAVEINAIGLTESVTLTFLLHSLGSEISEFYWRLLRVAFVLPW